MKHQLFTGPELPEGTAYYIMPKSVMRNKNLTPAQKLVYMELLDKVRQSLYKGIRINSKGQPYAEISYTSLAENLGMSDRTVKDAVLKLIEEKLIFCNHGSYKKEKKKNDCNRYYVYIPVHNEEIDEDGRIEESVPESV